VAADELLAQIEGAGGAVLALQIVEAAVSHGRELAPGQRVAVVGGAIIQIVAGGCGATGANPANTLVWRSTCVPIIAIRGHAQVVALAGASVAEVRGTRVLVVAIGSGTGANSILAEIGGSTGIVVITRFSLVVSDVNAPLIGGADRLSALTVKVTSKPLFCTARSLSTVFDAAADNARFATSWGAIFVNFTGDGRHIYGEILVMGIGKAIAQFNPNAVQIVGGAVRRLPIRSQSIGEWQ
jgi:hypothetical protein